MSLLVFILIFHARDSCCCPFNLRLDFPMASLKNYQRFRKWCRRYLVDVVVKVMVQLVVEVTVQQVGGG